MEGQAGTTKQNRPVLVVVVVLLFAIAATGVIWSVHYYQSRPHFQAGNLPTIAVQSPLHTTEAWFAAVNAHNMPLAEAHFAPRARDQMEWSSWGPPFQHLHCKLSSENSTSAVVGCTFKAIYDPDAGMSGDSAWGVSLRKQSSGRWLITNYGQG